jgi:hypothetical protein
MPSGHEITFKNVIFFSSTPAAMSVYIPCDRIATLVSKTITIYSIIDPHTLIAMSTLPPVASIGSTSSTFEKLSMPGGSFE